MQGEHPVCCTTSVAIGQKAFNNYNGIGMSVCFSPQAPSAAQLAGLSASSTLSRTASQLQPPPMLAVVLDASMAEEAMTAATQSLTQALQMLNPQTRLLLLVVDQVVSMVDLKTSKPQSWVVHGVGSQGASVLPQIVRAADIRATPLAHCEPFLATSLAALRHYPHQQSVQQHLRITAAAVDIALFLLTASMAAWDAQNKQQQQLVGGSTNRNGLITAQAGQQQGPTAVQEQQQQQQRMLAPMHNARVMVLTGLPNSSTPSITSAADLLKHFEQQQAQQLQQMFSAIGSKAASVDIPVDVITGSLSAPAALLLQGAVTASFGRLLYQPGLKPPLASNIAAIAQSRFGWEGVLDIRVPPGVKVVQLSGPAANNQDLPEAAAVSGSQVPVVLVGAGPRGAPPASLAAAAAADGTVISQQAGSPGAAGGPSPPASVGAAAAAAGGASGGVPAAAAAAGAVSIGLSAGPMGWSPAAAAVPVVSSGSRFVAVLELARDWQPGSSIEVQVVCEWTAADGRRMRQICSHTINVSDRLTPFLEGLDVPAVVLLMAQRLVAAALAAAAPSSAPLAAAAPPKPRSIEEGRLSVGMALAHVAQRLGHAHTSRRGILGFGSQQVWQLPDDLIPLALSLYQLQRSPLLDPYAQDPEPCEEAAPQKPELSSSSNSSSSALMFGSWRMLVQQFMQSGPNAALRMVAPWLYVFDSASGQFEVLPPLNLALEPDVLAVLDCGSELIIFVGEVLEALVEGIPTPRQREQQQKLKQPGPQASADPDAQAGEGQQQGSAAVAGATAAAGAAAAGPAAGSAAAAGSSKPAGSVPDMAVAAAPAVQCAHQLARGRLPVPAIRLIEDVAGMASMMQKLVPLHEDPVALQLLLLPHLRDLTPAQHGYLLDWHRHWASVAAAAAAAQGGGGGGGGTARAAGGARLTPGEEKQRQLSFGQWYSSFGVVLRSPGGILEGSTAVE